MKRQRPGYRGSSYFLQEAADYSPVIVDHATRRDHPRRDYTWAEAGQVVTWLNGDDQPLVITQSEADDPLLGQHRKA